MHNHMSMHMELDDEQDAIDDEYDFFLFFYEHDEYA